MEKQRFVSIAVPEMGNMVTMKQLPFLVRNDDGETLIEGSAFLQRYPTSGDNETIVMTREMAEEMIAAFLEKNDITIKAVRRALDMVSDENFSEEEVESIHHTARTFADTIFSSDVNSEELNKICWQEYLSALSSCHRRIATDAFGKRTSELFKEWNDCEATTPSMSDHSTASRDGDVVMRETVLYRAQAYASDIANGFDTEANWESYKSAIPLEHREAGEMAFRKRMSEMAKPAKVNDEG